MKAAKGSDAGACGAEGGGICCCRLGWGVVDLDAGADVKEANCENCGVGLGVGPLAVLSWVKEDSRAGPGIP